MDPYREPRPDLTTICLIFGILFFSFITIAIDIYKVLDQKKIHVGTVFCDLINRTITFTLYSIALIDFSTSNITKDDLPIKFDGVAVTKEKVADLNKVYVEFPENDKLNVTYSTTAFDYVQFSQGSDGIRFEGANHYIRPQCYEERFPLKSIDKSCENFTDKYRSVYFMVDVNMVPEKLMNGEMNDSRVVNVLRTYVAHIQNGILSLRMSRPFDKGTAMQLERERNIPVRVILEDLLSDSLKCVYLDDDGKVTHDMLVDGFQKQQNDKTFNYLYFFEIDDSLDPKFVVSVYKLKWTGDLTLKIRENMGRAGNVNFKLKTLRININRDPKTYKVFGISVNVKGFKHDASKDLNPEYSNFIDTYLPICIEKTIKRKVMSYLSNQI